MRERWVILKRIIHGYNYWKELKDLDVKISKMPKKIYNQRISYWNNSKNIWLFNREKKKKEKESKRTHKIISFKF